MDIVAGNGGYLTEDVRNFDGGDLLFSGIKGIDKGKQLCNRNIK